MNTKGYGIIIIMVVITLIVGIATDYIIHQNKTDSPQENLQEESFKGVGNLPYRATTTPENLTWTDQLIDTGAGTLGSVIITTSGNIAFDLLRATTTDITKRQGNKATSTILLATFPASASVGNYIFDASYSDGLYLDVKSGTLGSSTITYK